MKVYFNGPQPSRTIDAGRGKQIEAVRGEAVEVPAELGKRLVRQKHFDTKAGPASSGPNASKAAVKAAEKEGVDLAEVKGTGSGGAITVSDVKAAAEASNTANADGGDNAGGDDQQEA